MSDQNEEVVLEISRELEGFLLGEVEWLARMGVEEPMRTILDGAVNIFHDLSVMTFEKIGLRVEAGTPSQFHLSQVAQELQDSDLTERYELQIPTEARRMFEEIKQITGLRTDEQVLTYSLYCLQWVTGIFKQQANLFYLDTTDGDEVYTPYSTPLLAAYKIKYFH